MNNGRTRMKHKEIIIPYLFFVIALLIFITSQLQAEVTVYINDPSYIIACNENLTLNVNISGIEEPMRGFAINVGYDTTYLTADFCDLIEGDFLNSSGNLTKWEVTGENGNYTASCAILGVTDGVTGSGTLFTLELTSIAEIFSGTDVTLPEDSLKLRDLNNNPITADSIQGANVIIDCTPPEGVDNLVSPSHTIATWIMDNTIYVEWTTPNDPGSGLDGYSFIWEHNSNSIPDTTKDIEEDVTSLTSESLADGEWYFHIRGVDNVGNWSEETAHLGPFYIDAHPAYANIKVWLEGAYTSNSMTTAINSYIPLTSPYSEDPVTVDSIPEDVVDWVLVELRITATGSSFRKKSMFLKSDGQISDPICSTPGFLNTDPANYYTVIRHRNHLAIMSSSEHEFKEEGTALQIDLTTESAVYGTGGVTELETGVYGMFGGDANKDGTINAVDYNDYWRIQNGQPFDYNNTSADFNLDGTINAMDYNDYWRFNNGLATQVPNN